MAKTPDTDIERLKSEISLLRLMESSGIKLTRQGEDMAGLCPFHTGETPSLIVSEEKNIFHCSGCGAEGGVIEWVMKKNGVSFKHAVELLKEGTPDVTDAPVKQSRVRVLQAPVVADADDQALLNQVIDYYHRCLKTSPEALEYLKVRGIHNIELIETFKLGHANRTLGLRLPEKTRVAGAAIRTRLEKLGIYRESGHEHFSGSLVVPVLDERGGVQGAYGRKIRDNLRKGTPLHLCLPEPHRGVWNIKALIASKEIILCKALIDAMTFWCAGYRNVTASYGPAGFTADMLECFRAHGTQRVLIAYDSGADKVAALLMEAGIECWRINFPKGMDVNEYALNVQPASNSLGLLIRKAEWLGNGKAPVRPLPGRELPAPEAGPVESEEQGLGAGFARKEDAAIGEHKLPESPFLPASPVPPAPRCDLDAAVNDTEVVLSFGPRRWRVRGLPKNLAIGFLKVNVMVSSGDLFHVDTLDLYNARARAMFTEQAANEVRAHEDEIKGELGRVLLKLEQVQDEEIQKALAPDHPAHPDMTDTERTAALDLLKAPDLLDRILADFARCGMVGEETNTLTAYLAATSRKLDAPLGVVVQSSSAAGKTSLMDAVLAFLPEEDKVKYSTMTGQSLYYLGETSLKHKVLAIAEEEGASRASYALKLLQSEGELTIASTGADVDGNLITQEYRVEGPTAIITTTTAINVDEELMNRCLVLAVDEGRDQTRAIHARQRGKRTLAGLQAKQEKQDILALHRNAQRLLQPVAVVNPYADRLTFLDDRTRTRRDHEKYLTLIDAIALLHQHQRPVKTLTQGERTISYIEVIHADIVRATALAHEVLGRSLDELPPQTRRLLRLIREMAEERCAARQCPQSEIRFSRKELRDHTGIGDTQLRLHLDRLAGLEYVLAHRGRQGQNFVYELLFDGGDSAAPHLSGLIDAQALTEAAPVAQTSRGSDPGFAVPSRPEIGPDAGGARPGQTPQEPTPESIAGQSPDSGPESRISDNGDDSAPYMQDAAHVLA